jgi:uncharacterized membrane protein required for colicin V production
MMNELDVILIFIILVGIAVGLLRGVIRVIIGTIGIYFTVVITGYAYGPIGDTLSGALGRLGLAISTTGAHTFAYIVLVIALTVAVELISRATFEETRIRVTPALDRVLGGLFGVFYGALWASLFLVPGQYNAAQYGGAWASAVNGSRLVPTLNRVFRTAVLDVVRILFIDGVPRLFLNSVSRRVSGLFRTLASLGHFPL